MSLAYVAGIFLYLGALVWVAVRDRTRVHTQEDFSVAGRKLGTFVLSFTMLATWIGTGSLFGNSERTYQIGLAAWVLPVCSLGSIVALVFLAGRARALTQITIQDLLEVRYNATTRVFGVATILIAYATILSYQFRAAGVVLNLAIPEIPVEGCVVLMTAFIVSYTALAGMISVAHVGVITGLTMILGMGLSFPFLLSKAGGMEGLRATLDPSHFEVIGPIGLAEAISISLPTGLIVLGEPNLYQRFFSASSARVARRAAVLTIFGVIFMESMIILNAFVGSALEPALAIPGRVIAFAAQRHLHPALGVLVLTTMMAIILSTAGSCLLTATTAFTRDLYQRFLHPSASQHQLVRVLRITTVALGIAGYLLSTLSNEFLAPALLAYTIYGASITPVLVASFVWKRANGTGAVASILTATLTTLVWEWFDVGQVLQQRWQWGVIDAVIPAIILSLAALIAGSLLASPPRAEQVTPFFTPEKGS